MYTMFIIVATVAVVLGLELVGLLVLAYVNTQNAISRGEER